MTGRRWVADIFDDDDPAVRRLREAIALEPVQEPLERSETPPSTAERDLGPEELTPAVITNLIERANRRDFSAVEILRRRFGLDRNRG